jgi:hypothetical protein
MRRSSSLSCSSLTVVDMGAEGGSNAAMRSKSVGEVLDDGRETRCRVAMV